MSWLKSVVAKAARSNPKKFQAPRLLWSHENRRDLTSVVVVVVVVVVVEAVVGAVILGNRAMKAVVEAVKAVGGAVVVNGWGG